MLLGRSMPQACAPTVDRQLKLVATLVALNFHPADAADPYGDEPANNFFYYSCQELEQWVKTFRLGIDCGLG